jgi:hypothetical protein
MTRDQPPFVFGPLARAAAGVSAVLKIAIRSIGRGPMLVLSGLAMPLLFGAVLYSKASSPDGSLLQGVVAGAIAVLAFAGGAAWTLMWAFASEPPFVDNSQRAEALKQALAPTLRELAAVRADTMSRARARSLLRVPLGIAGATVLWVLMQWGSEPAGVAELIIFGIVGALAGEVWAVGSLDREYRQSYKDRVLPQLAARFGTLTYQRASAEHVAALEQHGIFTRFESAIAVDELRGTYKGLPIRLVQLRLERGSGDDTATVFDGLLVDLVLPRHLSGTTSVVADRGLWANLMRHRDPAFGRVTFDDPDFDRHFHVYGTDPAEVRALLTPRFRQRYLALANQTRFTLPGSLAHGSRFILALPKRHGVNLFHPSGFWSDEDSRNLIALNDDIEAALAMADSVIELFA